MRYYDGDDMAATVEHREGAWNRRRWMAAAAGVTGLASVEDMALAFSPAAYGVARSGRPRAQGPRSRMKIGSFETTLVASPDYALLNSWNVHNTHFQRAILELETTDGYTGVAEIGGAAFQALNAARDTVLGRDPLEIEFFRRSLSHRSEFAPRHNTETLAAVEIACLDLIGKVIDRPVVDLIGGPFRNEAPFSAYNFFVLPVEGGPEITTPEAMARNSWTSTGTMGSRPASSKGAF